VAVIEKDCGRQCEWVVGGVLEDDCAITTTSTPTEEPGCCKGLTFKSNEDCNFWQTQRECGRKCEWIPNGIVEEDCAMTTTSTPQGCCKGESYKSNLACNEKDDEQSCSRSGKCSWIVDGDIDVDCFMDATTPSPNEPTTTEPAGCCHGDLTSYRANDKCVGIDNQNSCERMSCNWLITDDPEDCVVTTTTSTPVTTESGCCAGMDKKSSAMCGEKIGRESCERSGKCEFRAGEDDCSWPTTTSEPWLGEKVQGSSMRRNSKRSRQQESMLFGGEGAVAQTMSTQVSLSTVLLVVAAAFAVYQLYRWYANSNSKKTQTFTARPNYQSV